MPVLPNICTSILAVLRQALDLDIRRMEPFAVRSRDQGPPAEETFCTDYMTVIFPVAMKRAIGNRHWNILLSTLAFTGASIALPLLAASYFERIEISWPLPANADPIHPQILGDQQPPKEDVFV